MSLPATPHDALFRALVASPARAGALLRGYLPEPVAGLLDPDTPPEAMEGSFVDEDAASTQCDALFRVRLRTGHDARIYVLLEHKSHVDAGTPLQILKYMVGIWQREIADGTAKEGLPPIIPLVFYHGRGRWTVPRSVAETIAAPEGLVPFLKDFAYILHDLGEIEPLRLSQAPEVRAAPQRGDPGRPARPDHRRAGCGERVRASYCALHRRAYEPDAASVGRVAASDEAGPVGGADGHRRGSLDRTGKSRGTVRGPS